MFCLSKSKSKDKLDSRGENGTFSKVAYKHDEDDK